MIFKKGNDKEPSNYRPIALLNSLLKLFTSIIQERLLQWCEEHAILPEAQAGFRKNRGCVDQIFTLNAILQIGTRRSGIYALYVDFAKAFDVLITVNYGTS